MPPDALHHSKAPEDTKLSSRPTPPQLAWLVRGASQPGGKLPLFDEGGQRISPRTIRACIGPGLGRALVREPPEAGLACLQADAGRPRGGRARALIGSVGAASRCS